MTNQLCKGDLGCFKASLRYVIQNLEGLDKTSLSDQDNDRIQTSYREIQSMIRVLEVYYKT